MQINGTLQGSARTYLTHMFGRGLDDERYVVERFLSAADGDIRPYGATERAKRGRKQPRKVMSLRAVQRLRPGRDEIIVCTGVTPEGLRHADVGKSRDQALRGQHASVIGVRRGVRPGRPAAPSSPTPTGRMPDAFQESRREPHLGAAALPAGHRRAQLPSDSAPDAATARP